MLPRCTITDERALRRVSRNAIIAYLESKGWTCEGRTLPPNTWCYPEMDEDEEPTMLVVPLDSCMPKSTTRPSGIESVTDFLRRLADIESRSEMEIWRDIVGEPDFGGLLQDLVEQIDESSLLQCRQCQELATRVFRHESKSYYPACDEHVPESGNRFIRIRTAMPLLRAVRALDQE